MVLIYYNLAVIDMTIHIKDERLDPFSITYLVNVCRNILINLLKIKKKIGKKKNEMAMGINEPVIKV